MYVEGVSSKPLVSLYSEPSYTGSPYTYPDNVATADQAFNRYGQYNNQLRFMFPGGDMRLGIRSKKHVADDWTCFDNFQLSFTGVTQGIDEATLLKQNEENSKQTVYDLQGREVGSTETLKPGIYISKGNKVVVK
jgi:hypothetical protein